MKDLIILLTLAVLPFAARAADVTGMGKADREHRALAGMSMGGGRSLNSEPGNLDTFAWIDGYPSAANTESPAQLVPDLNAATKELEFLSASTDDVPGLIRTSQGFHAHLKECRAPHFRHVDEPAHDFHHCERSLYHFAQLFFSSESEVTLHERAD